MELTPQAVRTTGFKTVRKGYEPEEVDKFKEQVASAIESAQNQATAMEARARAAVAKLQELTQGAGTAGTATPAGGTLAPAPEKAAEPPKPAELGADDAETISRTLLLAQRTADTAIADAKQEAARIVEEARVEGRKANEDERIKAESEVQSLLARRDFLLGDVDSLEQHLIAQRERLRETATAINDMIDRVPAGLGDVRRPLLSASDTPSTGTPSPDGAQLPSTDGA
jgi:DivIVA domain-containing protein